MPRLFFHLLLLLINLKLLILTCSTHTFKVKEEFYRLNGNGSTRKPAKDKGTSQEDDDSSKQKKKQHSAKKKKGRINKSHPSNVEK